MGLGTHRLCAEAAPQVSAENESAASEEAALIAAAREVDVQVVTAEPTAVA